MVEARARAVDWACESLGHHRLAFATADCGGATLSLCRFFRLSEIGTGLPWLVPEGKTLITADIGCQVNDELWQTPDDALGEKCVEALREMIPDGKERYLGCHVLRTPIAYPVYLNEYEAERQSFGESTGIDGLYSIGRNGEFAHILMENVYWRTRRKLASILAPKST